MTYTDNLESAEIFRKWCAISTVAAALERKVFVRTSSELYPNLYVILVGDAGIGKTRPIMKSRSLMQELPDSHIGMTSSTMAFLVDILSESKRVVIQLPDPPIEYNTVYLIADELSAFMNQYDNELVAGLTTFYDCVPYSQGRRTKDLRIRIERPQVNLLCGSTPSNLVNLMPEFAWEQGLTSRMLLIHSTERPIIDVFGDEAAFREMPKDMIHDLKAINSLVGQFGWTEDFAKAMHNWKLLGFPPVPEHPRLRHYCSRRFAHLLKLAMIASVDCGDALLLTKEDFNRAMGWLLEAELAMGMIFQSNAGTVEGGAFDEIVHFIRRHPTGVPEYQIVRFARDRMPTHVVMKAIEVLEMSGEIVATGILDPKSMSRVFVARVER